MTAIAKREREKLSRLERVRTAIGGAARKVGTLSVTWEEVTFSYSLGGAPADEDLGRSLLTIEMAVEKGRHGFVLLLDEAQVIRDERDRGGKHPLSLLISTVVALQRKEVPLALVVCGLPTLTGNLLRARSYTERSSEAKRSVRSTSLRRVRLSCVRSKRRRRTSTSPPLPSS